MTDQQPAPDRHPAHPRLALALAAGFAVVAAFIPLVPPEWRPWGFAAFGAIGLFTAARGGRYRGLPAAILLIFGSKLVFDLMNYAQHGYDAMWLPSGLIYACLALYALIGWALRRTQNPLAIGGAAFLASLTFFLVTNFADWVGQALPYHSGLTGLLESYSMAVPFWRGTLLSDLAFTAALFGLHWVLGRVRLPAGRPVVVPVENTSPRS